MYLIMNGYPDGAFWIYEHKRILSTNKNEELLTVYLISNFNLMLKWQICYTEKTTFFKFAINFRKSREKHTIFARKLRSTFRLSVRFLKTYCER